MDKVEQFIYTTNPTKGGAFGYVSRSDGLNGAEADMNFCTGIGTQGFGRNFLDTSKLSHYKTFEFEKRLKSDAKPRPKILGGGYRDSDYEQVAVAMPDRNIKVVEETHSGKISLQGDFRLNPEKAPYRIISSHLQDGRQYIARLSAIGRVYSDADGRQGNYFIHTMILPKGVELSPEQIQKVDFMKGLPVDKINGDKPIDTKMLNLDINDIFVKTEQSQKQNSEQVKTSKEVNYGLLNMKTQKYLDTKKKLDKFRELPEKDLTSEDLDKIEILLDRADECVKSIKQELQGADLEKVQKMCQMYAEDRKKNLIQEAKRKNPENEVPIVQLNDPSYWAWKHIEKTARLTQKNGGNFDRQNVILPLER